MRLQQAISLRIMELVHENGITLNQLAERYVCRNRKYEVIALADGTLLF